MPKLHGHYLITLIFGSTLGRVHIVAWVSPSARILVCLLLFLAGWVVYKFHPPHVQMANSAPAYRAPAEHRYALDGTFYMVRYAAVRTPKGTYGFEPGREMHLLKSCPDKHTVQVTDGTQAMEIDPLFLTRDLDVADAVRRADEAAQAALLNDRDTPARSLRDRAPANLHCPRRGCLRRRTRTRARFGHRRVVQPAEPTRLARGPGQRPSQLALPVPTLGDAADLNPALESLINHPAFGRLPSAER